MVAGTRIFLVEKGREGGETAPLRMPRLTGEVNNF